MKIKLSPVFKAGSIYASVIGKIITVDGVEYDFTPLLAGETLPRSALPENGPISSDVVCDADDEIHLTLVMPHSVHAPESVRFPWCYDVAQTVVGGEVPMPEGYYNA